MALAKLQAAASKVGQVKALGASPVQDDAPTIKVCVRLRPFIKEEIEGERSGGQTQLCISMPTETSIEMYGKDEETRHFDFDRCFWSHNEEHPLYATQETLQKELGETMLEQAMAGFNNCIFAYGQTGSGKSFSVLGGTGEARGLLPRVVEGLFDHIAKLPPDTNAKTLVAFLEIYNEQLADLLAQDATGKDRKLEVKQHPVLGTIIPGLTEAAVASCEEVMALVDYGTTMRHVSATAMNATSSRSHCIFTFKTSVSESGGVAKMSQTHLVDLAGSERAGRTKATGDRLKEGAAINQSLSTLARVISELAKKQKKKSNPPFRDSKLTYILKESLAGNSKTVMMAAISPNVLDYDETLSTLKFAQSVKQVQTKAVQNAVNEGGVEAQLRKELEDLKAQLAQAQTSGPGGDALSSEEEEAARRRLKEQEELCAWFGKDWDTLLAQERQRMQKRRATLKTDMAELASLREKYENMEETEQDNEENSDDDDDDDAEAVCPLVGIVTEDDGSAPEGGRNSITLKPKSSLAVVGPAAIELLQGPNALNRSNDLSKALQKLNADVSEVDNVLEKIEKPGGDGVRLRAVVLIDPEEGRVRAELLVQSKTFPSTSAWTGWNDCLEDGDELGTEESKLPEPGEEWMSGSELRKRLTWLKACKSMGAGKTKERSGAELWAAAKEVASGGAGGKSSNAADQAELTRLRDLVAELEAAREKDQEEMSKLRQAKLHAEGEKSRLEAISEAKEASLAERQNRPANFKLEKNTERQERARDVAKAIAASFENAIGAIDAAQEALAHVRPAAEK
eukprot:TRINITY_DN9758_c0_g1_i2.p1 TRINITY_DN9758_c0_g1~~TRINITY_DN9758_c0_g1_i2.p1  ORF type:complete len:824 (-),score=198.33 TRINITY_DN9758_c0_g1_i2:256-2646(-)